MSASPAELSLLAIADMVREIRTANGWQSEAGADVRLSPWFAEIADAQQTQALVYESSDTPVAGADLDGTMRKVRMEQVVFIEVYARPLHGREAQQYAQIKADLRRCILAPLGARLIYDGAELHKTASRRRIVVIDHDRARGFVTVARCVHRGRRHADSGECAANRGIKGAEEIALGHTSIAPANRDGSDTTPPMICTSAAG